VRNELRPGVASIFRRRKRVIWKVSLVGYLGGVDWSVVDMALGGEHKVPACPRKLLCNSLDFEILRAKNKGTN
jgi:hypothetical protein